jgi:hypothetical protein
MLSNGTIDGFICFTVSEELQKNHMIEQISRNSFNDRSLLL